MISWEEYFEHFFNEYRAEIEDLDTKIPPRISFEAPCQVEITHFPKKSFILWKVTHDRGGRDKQITVFERERGDPLDLVKRDLSLPSVSITGEATFAFEPSTTKEIPEEVIQWYYIDRMTGIFVIPFDPRKESVGDMISSLLGGFSREYVYRRLKRTTSQLKANIEQVYDKNVPSKLLETIKNLENSLTQVKLIDEHEKKLLSIEGEIGGVRKLIGTTKEYQDFRVFIADLEKLKESHIHKEVFQSEIKRLDQRIEDLKAIRFWSKRTLLEIALAIMAVIATLYGAGVIKF